MSKEMIKTMKDGSSAVETKKIELTDEQLASVEGGVWDFASNRLYDDSWEKVLLDEETPVLWKENGIVDHWAVVIGYELDGNDHPLYFDLDLINEPYIVRNVPSSEVLIDFAH
ncbi:MAG: hypothetical protein Q4D29_04965 [Lachnospiraceae bacterium]|nr:hypothetical protein [Lachnospiraceae bacterium]